MVVKQRARAWSTPGCLLAQLALSRATLGTTQRGRFALVGRVAGLLHKGKMELPEGQGLNRVPRYLGETRVT